MSKKERREQILVSARKVFAEKGYHDAKVGDIASDADVAKGTVYLYFKDKRSIFVELIDTLFSHLHGAILRVDTDGNVEDQVKHNIRAILSVLVDEPDTMRMLFAHASALDSAFATKIESFYVGLKALLTESLEDGQQLGIVAEGDARLYASFTLGALREILVEGTSGAEDVRSREEIVDALYAFLLGGILRVHLE